ncbi:MAG: exonuclease, partial [Symbiopectobacterium sp.]
YLLQMHAQMMCTGRKWCDFVSYDDRLPPDLAYYQLRIHQDDKLVAEIQEALTQFLAELERELEAIRKLSRVAA